MPSISNQANVTELTRWKQRAFSQNDEFPIFHLHGTHSDPENIIITGSDYHKLYFKDKASYFVEHIWSSEQLLIIGFGFSDPFLRFFTEKALREINCGVRHYAFIGVPGGKTITPLIRKSFISKYRLNPIFYRINGEKNDDHSDLIVMLRALNVADEFESQDRNGTTISLPNSIAKDILDDRVRMQDYTKNLFKTPAGKALYVEPRLNDRPSKLNWDEVDTASQPVKVSDIVNADCSFLIITKSESGATTLGQRIADEVESRGVELPQFADAATLPNYKNKLIKIFNDRRNSSKQVTRIGFLF